MKYIIIVAFGIWLLPITTFGQTQLKFDPILQIVKRGYANEDKLKSVAPHLELFSFTGDFANDSIRYYKSLSKWYYDFSEEREAFFKQIISKEEFINILNDQYITIQQHEDELFQKAKTIIDHKGYQSDLSIIAPHMPFYGCAPEKKQEWITSYPYEYKAILYNEKSKSKGTNIENAAKDKTNWLKENDSIRYKQIILNK